MLVLSQTLWIAQTNTFVLATEDGGQAVVIDAPPQPESLIRLLKERDLAPVALLLTHGHIDHTGGAMDVTSATGAVAYSHPDDDFLTDSPEDQLRLLFGAVPPGDYRPPPDRLSLEDRQVLELAGLVLEVVHTPGHSPGHCCFWLPDEGVLLSGDQLFAGSIGRTDLPGGSVDDLARSMRDRVMTLPDDVRVLPGHGPETTIGVERESNPFRELWS